MPVYCLERRLSHADVDFLGELKVAALLGLLEQAAVEASAAAGYDATRYTQDRRMWIIRRTRLERLVPVGGTDTIEVETEVIDFRRARSLRRYTVRKNSVAVAHATTDWVYCDLDSGRPTRIPEELQGAFMGGGPVPTLPRAAALPTDAPGEPVDLSIVVRPSHLDHLIHVNNAIYAGYLEDGAFALFAAHGWPLERMLAARGALRLHWLDAEYLSDAAAGESLGVHTWRAGEAFAANDEPPPTAELIQTIARSDGREILRARSDWRWRHKPPVVGGVPLA